MRSPLAKREHGGFLIDRAVTALGQLEDVMPDAPKISRTARIYRIEIIDIAERVHELAGRRRLAIRSKSWTLSVAAES